MHSYIFLGAKVDITTSYNSVYPTRIFDMQCFGNETKLLDCPHQESYTQSCSSYFTSYCQNGNVTDTIFSIFNASNSIFYIIIHCKNNVDY